MQRYTVYFIWKLLYMFREVGGTTTHHQKLQHLVFATPAVIVEEFELV
jgi:hypothetical protein